MATTDLDVQTDIVRALKAFAQKPEQMANWNGFAIYCMKIAAAFLVEFEAEFKGSNKKPAGVTPAVLADFNRAQATLTVSDINGYVNGRKKPQDFTEFVAHLKSNTVKADNVRLQAIMEVKDKEIADLTRKVSMLEKTYDYHVKEVKKQVTDLGTNIKELSSKLDENTTKSSEVTVNFQKCMRHEDELLTSLCQLVESKMTSFSPTDQNEIKVLLQVIHKQAELNTGENIGWYTTQIEQLTQQLAEARQNLTQTEKELTKLQESKTSISEKSTKILSSFNLLLKATEDLKFTEIKTIITDLSDITVIKTDFGDEWFTIFDELKKRLIDVSYFTYFSSQSTKNSFLDFFNDIESTFHIYCTSSKLKGYFYSLLGFPTFTECKSFYNNSFQYSNSYYKFPCIELAKTSHSIPQITLKKQYVQITGRTKILSKLHLKELELNSTILRLSLFLQHILNILIFLDNDIREIKWDENVQKFPGFEFHFNEILKYATDELCNSELVKKFSTELTRPLETTFTLLFSFIPPSELKCWHAPLSMFHHGMYLDIIMNKNLFFPPVFYVDNTKIPIETKKTTFEKLINLFSEYMGLLQNTDSGNDIPAQINLIPFEI